MNNESPQWIGKNLEQPDAAHRFNRPRPGKHPTWTKFVGLAELSIEQREAQGVPKHWVVELHGMQTIGLTDEKGLLKRFPLTDPVMPGMAVFGAAETFA